MYGQAPDNDVSDWSIHTDVNAGSELSFVELGLKLSLLVRGDLLHHM